MMKGIATGGLAAIASIPLMALAAAVAPQEYPKQQPVASAEEQVVRSTLEALDEYLRTEYDTSIGSLIQASRERTSASPSPVDPTVPPEQTSIDTVIMRDTVPYLLLDTVYMAPATPEGELTVRIGDEYLVLPDSRVVCGPQRECMRIDDVLARRAMSGWEVEVVTDSPVYEP